MTTRQVEVTQIVEVSIDETKLTPEWMASFRESFYNFHVINDHLKHLAQLEARGLMRNFIEGYGDAKDFEIKARVVDEEIEVRP